MDDNRPINDSRAQAALDDARLEARKNEILGPSKPTRRATPQEGDAANPEWLTRKPAPHAAKPVAKKTPSPARQPARKPVRRADVRKRSADDDSQRQAED
jgi:hypothetical protein